MHRVIGKKQLSQGFTSTSDATTAGLPAIRPLFYFNSSSFTAKAAAPRHPNAKAGGTPVMPVNLRQ
jgi:hypothetical protein